MRPFIEWHNDWRNSPCIFFGIADVSICWTARYREVTFKLFGFGFGAGLVSNAPADEYADEYAADDALAGLVAQAQAQGWYESIPPEASPVGNDPHPFQDAGALSSHVTAPAGAQSGAVICECGSSTYNPVNQRDEE